MCLRDNSFYVTVTVQAIVIVYVIVTVHVIVIVYVITVYVIIAFTSQ